MNLKPKMLFFTHICSDSFITGAERLLLFYMRELTPYFHCLLVSPNEGEMTARARSFGAMVIIQPIPTVISAYLALPSFMNDLTAQMRGPEWEALISLLEREQPNYVLVGTSVHPLPAAAAKLLGIPVVWAVMETMKDGAVKQQAARFIHQISDVLIGISETTLAPYLEAGDPMKRLMLPPSWYREELEEQHWPALRAELRAELGLSEGQPLVGFIASALYREKGLHEFMTAAVQAAAVYEQARFVIIGHPVDMDLYNRSLELVSLHGLSERFTFIRFVPNIEKAYCAMDLVVIPSLLPEGFGMTALEGMVFGKPVISFASGGLAEIHHATGSAEWLVPTGEVELLAEQMKRLLADEPLRGITGLQNAAAAEAAFGLVSFRERLHQLLVSLTGMQRNDTVLVKGSGARLYMRSGGQLLRYSGSIGKQEAARVLPDELLTILPITGRIGRAGRKRRRAKVRSTKGKSRKHQVKSKNRSRASRTVVKRRTSRVNHRTAKSKRIRKRTRLRSASMKGKRKTKGARS